MALAYVGTTKPSTISSGGTGVNTSNDFAAMVQDGDLLIAQAYSSNVNDQSYTTPAGWTLRTSEFSANNGSNWYTLAAYSKKWSSGDATTLALTDTNLRGFSLAIHIFRSNYQAANLWTFTVNTKNSPGTPSSVLKQLTPVNANDLRVTLGMSNAAMTFQQMPGLNPVSGQWSGVWGGGYNSPVSTANGFMMLGYGTLPIDTGDVTCSLLGSSQLMVWNSYALNDGDSASGYYTYRATQDHDELSEIYATTDAEGFDAGTPAGLNAAAGRFEGGSHIY